ncbi:membrane or secreted protein containing Peptidase S53, propeptide domain protein [mine drainage metagenome]|uniref:Membrane or secreted protein containing Peptidase S53, propeptide domain protein n=1 Tax=mine drainage metagenome TaxID=410659 RepID=T1A057_9ZZZZ
MHGTVAQGSRQARALRRRIGPALAIAVLLASPLAAGLAGGRGFSAMAVAGGSSGVLPLPSALVNETYIPTSYSEAGYRLAGAVATGRALPAELPIVVTLGFSNASELTRLLSALSDPSSPEFQHYLTASQFDEAFAPSSGTYAAALAYFEALGARGMQTFTDRVTISFEASPSSADRMFHTTVQEWSLRRTGLLRPGHRGRASLGARAGRLGGRGSQLLCGGIHRRLAPERFR